jgi:transposase-like protein
MPKKYQPKIKFQVVLEALESDQSVAQVARNYDVHPNTVHKWIDAFKENGQEVFSKDGEIAELEQKITELEQLVGQKEREIALLKNFLGQSS